jgi:hypothetical protein
MLKRLLIPAVAALIVAVIVVAGYYQNHDTGTQSYDVECVQPSQPTAAAASLTCRINPSQNAQQGKTGPQWWHVLLAWPEGITAWLLMLTLGAVVWQSWEFHEQNRHMVNKERARIDVGSPVDPLELDDGPEWVDAMNVVHAGTRITVTNSGGTNAFNVIAKARIIRTSGEDISPFAEKISLLDLPGTLRAGIDPISIGVVTLLDGVNHVAAVNDGSEVLYLVGSVVYEDVFGNKRITPFRYRWDVDVMYVEGQSVDSSWWKKTPEGNRAT